MHKMICREIRKEDLKNNFPDVLAGLTVLGNMNEKSTELLYEKIKNNENQIIFVVVDENNPQVLGCATLLIEDKFIRNYGKVGHIEDVVVDNQHRKKGIGSILVEKCIEEARKRKCYKAILCCKEKNVEFYEKIGMFRKGVEMALYFDEELNK